jgi:hypothetical protein
MQKKLKFQLPQDFCKQRSKQSHNYGSGALTELFYILTRVVNAKLAKNLVLFSLLHAKFVNFSPGVIYKLEIITELE